MLSEKEPRMRWQGLRDPRPALESAAHEMRDGHYHLGGLAHHFSGASPFEARLSNPAARDALQSFAWLRHFSASSKPAIREHAALLAQSWLQSGGASPRFWSPAIVARRVISWLGSGDLLLSAQDSTRRAAILKSLHRQARYLRRFEGHRADPQRRFAASCALTLYGLSFPQRGRIFQRALAHLEEEAERQILPDGGHISRSPSEHLSYLFDILLLARAFEESGRGLTPRLQGARDRMQPMARFFRHGDGSLALFNGAMEGSAEDIRAAMAHDDARGRPFGDAPHSGYQRLAAEKTLVLMDAGAPPPPQYARLAHAGCLSFEMSSGKERIIVNCGGSLGLSSDWRLAARATAAHSTLSPLGASSALFEGASWRRGSGREPLLKKGPRDVRSQREESDKGLWLNAAHDGYVRPFGTLHERRLYLAASGAALWGEDRLVPVKRGRWLGGARERRAMIRFHLHPHIRAAELGTSGVFLLRLPNGEGWRMRAEALQGAIATSLQDSVYLGEEARARFTRQIVIEAETRKDHAFHARWLFERLAPHDAKEKAL